MIRRTIRADLELEVWELLQSMSSQRYDLSKLSYTELYELFTTLRKLLGEEFVKHLLGRD